jgi:hypothetical protein
MATGGTNGSRYPVRRDRVEVEPSQQLGHAGRVDLGVGRGEHDHAPVLVGQQGRPADGHRRQAEDAGRGRQVAERSRKLGELVHDVVGEQVVVDVDA